MDGILTEDWSEFVNESYKSRKQREFMTNKDLFSVLLSKLDCLNMILSHQNKDVNKTQLTVPKKVDRNIQRYK